MATSSFIQRNTDAMTQHLEVLKELGDCHGLRGDFAAAQACYLEAAEVAPESPLPDVGLGAIARRQGNLAEARRAYQAALEKDNRCCLAYEGLAWAYLQSGAYPAACELCLKALESDKENLQTLETLFEICTALGEYSQVRPALDSYLDRHPGEPRALVCLAAIDARENRQQEARETLLTVLTLEPDNCRAVELLAELDTGGVAR